MINLSLKVRRRPYSFGGTKIEFGGENYYVKYSGCSEADAIERAEQMVKGSSHSVLEKGGSIEIKIQDSR